MTRPLTETTESGVRSRQGRNDRRHVNSYTLAAASFLLHCPGFIKVSHFSNHPGIRLIPLSYSFIMAQHIMVEVQPQGDGIPTESDGQTFFIYIGPLANAITLGTILEYREDKGWLISANNKSNVKNLIKKPGGIISVLESAGTGNVVEFDLHSFYVLVHEVFILTSFFFACHCRRIFFLAMAPGTRFRRTTIPSKPKSSRTKSRRVLRLGYSLRRRTRSFLGRPGNGHG